MKQTSHLVLAVIVMAALGCAGGTPEPTRVHDASRVSITVSDAGFDPGLVTAKRGEPLTMVFTRKTESVCAQEVVIPDHGIRKELSLDEPVEITFIPAVTGHLAFTCGMGMMKGAIIVQ